MKRTWPRFGSSVAYMFALLNFSGLVLAQNDVGLQSPVVVELFTSEGCSSCPPADKLLENLRSDDVMVLSFHVDYWNYLGWSDPFSSPDSTARQKQYAQLFQLDQVYTPQMIVSGETEFVGSNGRLASAAILKAKKDRATPSLKLAVSIHPGKIRARYSMGKVAPMTRLNLAVVQESTFSKATAGENAGARLSHVNVVRLFQTIEVGSNKTGEAELEIPEGVKTEQLFLAGYLQDYATGRISDANMQPIR